MTINKGLQGLAAMVSAAICHCETSASVIASIAKQLRAQRFVIASKAICHCEHSEAKD